MEQREIHLTPSDVNYIIKLLVRSKELAHEVSDKALRGFTPREAYQCGLTARVLSDMFASASKEVRELLLTTTPTE